MAFPDAGHSGYDLAGRAIPALKRILVDEGLLNGMKRALRSGKSFDRRDLGSLQDAASVMQALTRSTIDQDRAGSARALVAALLCPVVCRRSPGDRAAKPAPHG